MQLVGQPVLLDEALRGQGHRAALRVAHADAAPAVSERVAHLVHLAVGLVEADAVARCINHLAGRQFLIEAGVGMGARRAVALVVGQYHQVVVGHVPLGGMNDQSAAGVVHQHAHVGIPAALIAVSRRALLVAGDGHVAADDDVVDVVAVTVGHAGQSRELYGLAF